MKLLKKGDKLLSEEGKLLFVDIPDLKPGEAISSVVMDVPECEDTHPNRATGARSMAIGNGTIAKEKNQLVIGTFNEDEENALFIVGNGNDADDRSNALEVLKDGRVKSNGIPTEDNDLTTVKYVDEAIEDLIDEGKKILDENTVKKTTTGNTLYGVNVNGQQQNFKFYEAPYGNTIPYRDSKGQLKVVETPTENQHATSKKYVDDTVASAGGGKITKIVEHTTTGGEYGMIGSEYSIPNAKLEHDHLYLIVMTCGYAWGVHYFLLKYDSEYENDFSKNSYMGPRNDTVGGYILYNTYSSNDTPSIYISFESLTIGEGDVITIYDLGGIE